jgi:hypothetical protein
MGLGIPQSSLQVKNLRPLDLFALAPGQFVLLVDADLLLVLHAVVLLLVVALQLE